MRLEMTDHSSRGAFIIDRVEIKGMRLFGCASGCIWHIKIIRFLDPIRIDRYTGRTFPPITKAYSVKKLIQRHGLFCIKDEPSA